MSPSGYGAWFGTKIIVYFFIMDYTKVKGNITELMCIAGFIELGYQVSIPYGDSAKYDFVVDVNGKFWRVQCKSSHVAHHDGKEDFEAFSFGTISQTVNTKKTVKRQYTKKDIDYFATWHNNNVYIVPVEETSTSKTLRLSPPKNGNCSYNDAKNYLLSNVLKSNVDLIKSKQTFTERNISTVTKYFCKKCGKEISRSAEYCPTCSAEKNRKTVRPNREVLKSEIRTQSFRALGLKYNVSDKAISK